MPTWSHNNRASKTLWTTLRVLQQYKETFDKAGSLTMKKLAFWKKNGTPDLKRTAARSLATQMDGIFIEIRGAQHEPQVKKNQALESMVAVMIGGDKTMEDLAEVVDAAYRFLDE